MAQAMTGQAKSKGKLSFQLTDEQLRALRPMIEANGRISVAGTLEGNTFSVSFVACNAAFLACNAAFRVEPR
jgi:hypothetical protein